MENMAKQIIQWVGHGSWKMITPEGTVIYLDPWIKGNPSCKISMDDTKDAQVVIVTHGHDDHIGNSIEICKNTGATLVTLPDVMIYVDKYHGIPYDKGGGAIHVGGTIRMKDIVIHCVHAEHYSNIWGDEYQKDKTIMPGNGCSGMVVECKGGRTVYFAGDTGVFGDMALISELYHPYVSILPVGGKYVMEPYEAAKAAELLKSPVVIPGHYDTFPAIKQDMNELKRLVTEKAPWTQVVVLRPSETFEP
jgi:L-ascorbate metabolism protein UlaG (beta-lactamase superfamily)